MNDLYKKFVVKSYLSTGGFTPFIPNLVHILPGDFFQIEKGQLKVLGNLFKDGILDKRDVDLQYDIHQYDENWDLSEGVDKPFFGQKNIQGEFQEEEKSVRAFRFECPGSFFFQGKNPKSVKISNWDYLKDQLIIKMTQVLFSFREVYLVTESAYLDQWMLAVANSREAELELRVQMQENGPDLFGHVDAKALYAKHIECYKRGSRTSLPFFKAKRLSARDTRNSLASIDAISSENALVGWANDAFDFDFRIEDQLSAPKKYSQIAFIDQLRANELNPTTALEFFHWTDFNLDDIENLFG